MFNGQSDWGISQCLYGMNFDSFSQCVMFTFTLAKWEPYLNYLKISYTLEKEIIKSRADWGQAKNLQITFSSKI